MVVLTILDKHIFRFADLFEHIYDSGKLRGKRKLFIELIVFIKVCLMSVFDVFMSIMLIVCSS